MICYVCHGSAYTVTAWADPAGGGDRGWTVRTSVAICFLRNNGAESPFRTRSVQPSVKYVDCKKSFQDPPPHTLDESFWVRT